VTAPQRLLASGPTVLWLLALGVTLGALIALG
jgi:hypothetical protein